MFERFTTGARQAVVAAQGEARRLGHGYVGTEHLLLGLLAVGDGIAADVLRDAGIDATMVEGEVVRIVGRRSGRPAAGDETDAEADADALRLLGIDLDAVREAAEAAFGPGALDRARPPGNLWPARSSRRWSGRRWSSRRRRRSPSCRAPAGLGLGRSRMSDWESPLAVAGRVPFTPRAKKVLELALREALALRRGEIGTEHVLLGLIREGEGLAAEVLVLHGVALDDLRRRVLAALDDAA